MLKLKIKKVNIALAVIICLMLITMGSYIVVLVNVRKDLDEQTKSYITNITSEVGRYVNLKIEERFKTLENYGYFFMYGASDDDNDEVDEWIGYLEEYANKEKMEKIEVLTYDEAYLNSGNRNITSEIDDNGRKYICMYVPISVNEQKCIIKGTYDAEIFGKLVSDDILGVSQNSFIINRSGDIIAGGKKDHELKDIFSNNIKYASILKNHITSRDSGHITYTSGNLKRYICYSELDYNNWYVFSIVTSGQVEKNYDEVNGRGIFLSVVLILFIIALSVYIGFFNYKYSYYKKVVEEQINNDSEIIEEKEIED
ncbi:MAG: hypothetical protein E7266_10745 [Lachnospiraceae bacterium]|nr:hypothetical protein [Lachnospiraceae bacterium]